MIQISNTVLRKQWLRYNIFGNSHIGKIFHPLGHLYISTRHSRCVVMRMSNTTLPIMADLLLFQGSPSRRSNVLNNLRWHKSFSKLCLDTSQSTIILRLVVQLFKVYQIDTSDYVEDESGRILTATVRTMGTASHSGFSLLMISPKKAACDFVQVRGI